MICLIIGLPGPLSAWLDAVLSALLRLRSEKVSHFRPASSAASVLDEAALEQIRRNADHVVVQSNFPNDTLLRVLETQSPPFLLALEDPRKLVAQQFKGGITDLIGATRSMAQSSAMLERFVTLRSAAKIAESQVHENAVASISRIARHLSIAASDEEITLIADQIPLEERLQEASVWKQEVPVAAHNMIDGALGAYAASFAGDPFDGLIWTRELFLLAGEIPRPPVQPINLRATANGRLLVYGPYMHLPPGHWIARLTIGVSPEALGQTFTLEAVSQIVLKTSSFSPKVAGITTAEVDFLIEDEGSNLELRLLIGRDSAPGEVTFGHVQLRKSAAHLSLMAANGGADYLSALQL